MRHSPLAWSNAKRRSRALSAEGVSTRERTSGTCRSYFALRATLCLAFLMPAFAHAQPVRFMLHGNMSHELPTEEYLRFVEEAKPDILVMGVFDQRLYVLANAKKPIDPQEHLAKWKFRYRVVYRWRNCSVERQPERSDLGRRRPGASNHSGDGRLGGSRPAGSAWAVRRADLEGVYP